MTVAESGVIAEVTRELANRVPKTVRAPLPMKDRIIIRAEIMSALRGVMQKHDFTEIFLPAMTGVTGSCENVPNIWFMETQPGQIMPLRQTAQLQMEELLICSGLPRMYTSGRSFRKEERDGRHLADFELFEFEAMGISFDKLLQYNWELMEAMIVQVLQSKRLDYERHANLYYWYERMKSERTVIRYEHALARLKDKGIVLPWGSDLKAAHERVLTLELGFVQVTHMPRDMKFFNMEDVREEEHLSEPERSVWCVDLLGPYGGEIFGASRREWEATRLRYKFQRHPMHAHMQEEYVKRGMDPSQVVHDMEPYFALFDGDRYLPRAGAGIGVARAEQCICSEESILPL
jgi:aspartyl/asparaginyl-tRNA synthetase